MQNFQIYTYEDYVGNSEFNQDIIQSVKKYHGDVIHLDSINKDVKVHKSKRPYNEFNFNDAEPLELTKAEWGLVCKEMPLQEFDWETWAK